ncbi:MAG: MBL fold metallo-hydrolase [Firmicutes bacterium]|nr:MBL fold metallo-hydrolase [Bacillota bacterium]
MESRLVILGARGSVPVFGTDYRRYGGNTTCFLAEMAGQPVVLDAGTGLLRLPADVLYAPELPLLLTHPHTDHLLGLPMSAYLTRPEACLTVYGAERDGKGVRAQINCLMRPPLWPVTIDKLPARVLFRTVSERFTIGPVTVRTAEGIHPGGVTLYRLEADGKSVVLITDCTLKEEFLPRALEFARGADLLLVDGQYSNTEWASRSVFGHNTWKTAAEFGRASCAKIVRIVHHDPTHSDDVLDAAARTLASIHPDCAFAREGETIAL